MRREFDRALVLLATVAALGTLAFADVAATVDVDYPNFSAQVGAGGVIGDGERSIGWRFFVDQEMTITHLGVFDEGGDGLASAHTIGIWKVKAEGGLELVRQADIGPGGTTDGDHVYIDIEDITLVPNPVPVSGGLERWLVGVWSPSGNADALLIKPREAATIDAEVAGVIKIQAYTYRDYPDVTAFPGDVSPHYGAPWGNENEREFYFGVNFKYELPIPVADAGPDQTVECEGPDGTEVTLDGSGSSAPDSVATLTYAWTWDGGSATGVNPMITLPCGTTTVTLVVNDGTADSEPDTVLITVVDTTAPVMTAPGDAEIQAMGPDGVPIDDDRIQAFLDGVSANDLCDPDLVITNNAPAVFPVGDTVVSFTATDASGNSATCSSTVTVVEAAESSLRIVPRIINREGRLERILGVIRFPEGTAEEDIDMDVPLVLYPGDSPTGIEASSQKIVTWSRWGQTRVSVFGFFSKDDVTAAVPDDGWLECMMVGRFVDGQYFYGTRTVKIVSWDW